jgi:DNA-binding LytR/AlgR family response regulator
MNCIIIEDEQHAAEHLEYLLLNGGHDVTVQARIDSVKNAVIWLKNNSTDLIFLDVQLGDDISFSIFENVQVSTPVIFTTSYNEYAIKAFELNSLAYLLKPIDPDELRNALDKYSTLYKSHTVYESLSRLNSRFQKRFLVQSGNLFHSIPQEQAAFFYVEERHLFIHTTDDQKFLLDSSLESLESRLDPDIFFRINRQFIVAIHAIRKMHNHTRGRVRIETDPLAKEELIVSIDRANEFKNWLNK